MKQKKVLLLFLGVVLVIALLFGGTFLLSKVRNSDKQPGTSNTRSNEPYLELTVKKNPQRVETICQQLQFVIQAKNTGVTALTMKQITDSAYKFAIMEKSGYNSFLFTNTLQWAKPTLTVAGLTELKPGQTQELTFTTSEKLDNGDGTQSSKNGFESLFMKGNGKYDFEVTFQKIEQNNTVVINSNRPTFSLEVDAFEGNKTEIGYLNKVCD